jgi:hypothetical protein
MPIHVVLMERGSPKPLYTWSEMEEPMGEEKWKQVALDLTRKAQEGKFSVVEVFICVYGEHLSDLLNYKDIREAVSASRAHSWGASTYVVVDNGRDYRSELIDHVATFQSWFDEIYKAGATDVLHTSLNLFDSGSESDRMKALSNLQSSASNSRLRQRALPPVAKWRCLLRKEDAFLHRFLGAFEPYSEASLPLQLDGNLLTILEVNSPITQKNLVDKALISCHDGKHLVAMRHPCLPSAYLRHLKDIGRLEVVSYRGSFELVYMLQWLNAKWRNRKVQTRGKEKQVVLNPQPVFQPIRNAVQPTLLLTSAFDPDTDEENCLLAAREAGQATRRKPSHAEYLVQPSVTCQNLPGLLDSLSAPLTVWLHLGHGIKRIGLEEAVSGEIQSPRRWLECFSAYGSSLSLVVFSTCESTTIARRFAQAGAGVAIGFEKEVPSEACEYLTAEVVGAALNFNGDFQAILQAFHIGCARLVAHGHRDLGPVAFYSQK